MRIFLFLTTSYPDSRRSATILCTHRVMEAFAKDPQNEVHCLCLQYQGEKREDVYNGVQIHRIPQTLFEGEKYKNSLNPSSKRRSIFQLLDRIQKFITIPLYPCISPFQLRLWKKYANDLNLRFSFDCIVAEHYGYNTLVTGLGLKKRFPYVKYIPLLWDPIDGQVVTAKLPASFTERRIHAIENDVGKYADMIISTVAMKAYYKDRGDPFINKRAFLDIPSILRPEAEVHTDYINLIEKKYINIVFSGYIDSHRDINPVLHLLNHSQIAHQLNVLFFCKGCNPKDMSYWESNFKGKITFHGYIPLPELHAIYRHSDYLLNISSINPNLIPSKIFEYMSFGKPVLSFYTTEGDSAKKYLDRYPEACVIDIKENEECLLEQLDSFFSQKHNFVDFSVVEKIYPENTPVKYVQLISNFLICN